LFQFHFDRADSLTLEINKDKKEAAII